MNGANFKSSKYGQTVTGTIIMPTNHIVAILRLLSIREVSKVSFIKVVELHTVYYTCMNPVMKESKGRSKDDSIKHASSSIKGIKPHHGKKYLPSSAFIKTVKTSTTKSLLKFRERQEHQELKRLQQHKSYQRLMKREGYDISNNRTNRKRLRDDSLDNKHNDDENTTNDKCDMDTLKKSSDTEIMDSKSGTSGSQDFTDDLQRQPSKDQKLSSTSTNDQRNDKIGKYGSERVLKSKTDDLQGKHKQSEKWKKQKNHQQEEQRRVAENKQRQIQAEQEKKLKLKQRQERHKLLSARTSRGQPVMKNIALDILNKLQREQQQQQQQQDVVSNMRNR